MHDRNAWALKGQGTRDNRYGKNRHLSPSGRQQYECICRYCGVYFWAGSKNARKCIEHKGYPDKISVKAKPIKRSKIPMPKKNYESWLTKFSREHMEKKR